MTRQRMGEIAFRLLKIGIPFEVKEKIILDEFLQRVSVEAKGISRDEAIEFVKMFHEPATQDENATLDAIFNDE